MNTGSQDLHLPRQVLDVTGVIQFTSNISGSQPLDRCYTNRQVCLCMIKIFLGGKGGDTFKAPSSLQTTFAFTHPCFKMFLERSLNYPPHHPTSSILHCYHPPHPPALPSPLKILIIHIAVFKTEVARL